MKKRTVLAAGLMAAAISGAAPLPAVAAAEPGATITGNYLAARHAQYARDTKAAAEYYLEALKNDPDNADLLQRTFLILAADGHLDEALTLARRLLEQINDDSLSILALMSADVVNGRLKEANALLDRLPDSGISTFITPLLRAWLLAGEKKYDEAVTLLKERSSNEGLAILYGAHTALIDDIAGNTEAAETAYQTATDKRQAPNLRLTLLFGNFHERNGAWDKARAVYDAYSESHPGTTVLETAYKRLDSRTKPPRDVRNARDGLAEALFSIAGSIRQQDSFETILLARLALYLREDFGLAKLLVAELLEGDGRLEDANAIYRDIERDAPFSWMTRLRIATNLDQMGKTDQAALELRTMARERTDRYDMLVSLGDIMRRHERYREAADAYADAKARISSIERQHWAMLYATGIAYERLKEWDKAEPAFLKALELEPGQPFVLNYLGYSWVEQGKNLKKARQMIEEAVEKRPTDGYIVDSLGWVLYRLGDLPGAVTQLERAVELRPEDPTINDHLGDVYWYVGRRNEARFQWNHALILDPDEELEEKIREKIENGLPDTKPKDE